MVTKCVKHMILGTFICSMCSSLFAMHEQEVKCAQLQEKNRKELKEKKLSEYLQDIERLKKRNKAIDIKVRDVGRTIQATQKKATLLASGPFLLSLIVNGRVLKRNLQERTASESVKKLLLGSAVSCIVGLASEVASYGVLGGFYYDRIERELQEEKKRNQEDMRYIQQDIDFIDIHMAIDKKVPNVKERSEFSENYKKKIANKKRNC